MKAIVIDEFCKRPLVKKVPDSSSDAKSVIIELKASGICRSDWHGWMGHDPDVSLPHVPGHELSGVVIELGNTVENWKIGDRVTVPFSCGCGFCKMCKSGNQQICDNYFQPGFTHWGSFAEFVEIKYAEENLVRIPDDYSFDEAAILGCRFGTSYRALVDQARISEKHKVLIAGCGGVGLSALLIAKAKGAWVICMDKNPNALKIASQLGADEIVVNNSSADAITEIMELSDGGCHVSVDAIGHQETVTISLNCLLKRGKHVQIGLLTENKNKIEINGGNIISRELEFMGSHGIQAYRYASMLALIKEAKINLEQLIDKRVAIDEAVDPLIQMGENNHRGVTVITEFQ